MRLSHLGTVPAISLLLALPVLGEPEGLKCRVQAFRQQHHTGGHAGLQRRRTGNRGSKVQSTGLSPEPLPQAALSLGEEYSRQALAKEPLSYTSAKITETIRCSD